MGTSVKIVQARLGHGPAKTALARGDQLLVGGPRGGWAEALHAAGGEDSKRSVVVLSARSADLATVVTYLVGRGSDEVRGRARGTRRTDQLRQRLGSFPGHEPHRTQAHRQRTWPHQALPQCHAASFRHPAGGVRPGLAVLCAVLAEDGQVDGVGECAGSVVGGVEAVSGVVAGGYAGGVAWVGERCGEVRRRTACRIVWSRKDCGWARNGGVSAGSASALA